MTATAMENRLIAAGFAVRLWHTSRLYLDGYGADLTIYIDWPPPHPLLLDEARIVVTSSWRSRHAAMRCKGAKHVVLQDLFAAGLLSAPPPDDWRRVILDERPLPRRASS